MRVMLTGAHGIGKSATALNLSKLQPEFLYIPSFAGSVAKRLGYDLNKNPTPEEAVVYQENVLNIFVESYKATACVHSVYDRSPIDLAAYCRVALQDIPGYEKYIAFYTRRCLEATIEYCDVLVYPDFDKTEDMEPKYNRPTGDKWNRTEFDKLIDSLVQKVAHSKLKIIDVPAEYQYADRVDFIWNKLKWMKLT